MRFSLSPESTDEVRRFLKNLPRSEWRRLERIDPEYVWILRECFRRRPRRGREIARDVGNGESYLFERRDQALFILGFPLKFTERIRKTATARLEHFTMRQKLTYIESHGRESAGDQKVIRLILKCDLNLREVSRRLRWKSWAVDRIYARLLELRETSFKRVGFRVRREAFRSLLDTRTNPKAELELEILEALHDGKRIIDLADEWDVPASGLSQLISEVRTDLQSHRSTRLEFERWRKKCAAKKLMGNVGKRVLNSGLLPIYLRYRKDASPFSRRERAYLTARANGASITSASEKAGLLSANHGSACDRAFLRQIHRVELEYPNPLPLPEFTEAQVRAMKRLKYRRV